MVKERDSASCSRMPYFCRDRLQRGKGDGQGAGEDRPQAGQYREEQ